jgi:hypothetical protein
VDAHAKPRLGEPKRRRASGNATPDDRDVDAAVMATVVTRRNGILEPVRIQDVER